MNLLNTMKKLVGTAAALLLATSMSFGQSESSIEFTIPYADAAQQAEVEAMGGSAVANLAEGSYTMVSSKQVASAKSLKGGNAKAENDGIPLELDCSNITDTPLSCRADLPPVDFDLPIILHSQGAVTRSALTIIPGDSGCPGDAVTITRTYFVQDQGLDPMDNGDNGMEQCMQTFTVLSENGPEIVCPADVMLDCFTDDTTPAATGMAAAIFDCPSFGGQANGVVTFSDVSTQVIGDPVLEYNYTITRTWSVTDGCGRTATCNQTITVASDNACLVENGIPTMGQWALFILALLMSSLAVVFIKRKSRATA